MCRGSKKMDFKKAAEGRCSGNFEAFNAMRKVYLGDMPDGARVFYGFSGVGVQSGQIFLFDRDAYAEKCGNMKFMSLDDPLLGQDFKKIIHDKLINVIDDGGLIYDPPGQGKPDSLAHAWNAEGKELALLEFADKNAVVPQLEFVDPPKAIV